MSLHIIDAFAKISPRQHAVKGLKFGPRKSMDNNVPRLILCAPIGSPELEEILSTLDSQVKNTKLVVISPSKFYKIKIQNAAYKNLEFVTMDEYNKKNYLITGKPVLFYMIEVFPFDFIESIRYQPIIAFGYNPSPIQMTDFETVVLNNTNFPLKTRTVQMNLKTDDLSMIGERVFELFADLTMLHRILIITTNQLIKNMIFVSLKKNSVPIYMDSIEPFKMGYFQVYICNYQELLPKLDLDMIICVGFEASGFKLYHTLKPVQVIYQI